AASSTRSRFRAASAATRKRARSPPTARSRRWNAGRRPSSPPARTAQCWRRSAGPLPTLIGVERAFIPVLVSTPCPDRVIPGGRLKPTPTPPLGRAERRRQQFGGLGFVPRPSRGDGLPVAMHGPVAGRRSDLLALRGDRLVRGAAVGGGPAPGR